MASANSKLQELLLKALEGKGIALEEIDENLSLTETGILDSFEFVQLLVDFQRAIGSKANLASYKPSELDSIRKILTLSGEA